MIERKREKRVVANIMRSTNDSIQLQSEVETTSNKWSTNQDIYFLQLNVILYVRYKLVEHIDHVWSQCYYSKENYSKEFCEHYNKKKLFIIFHDCSKILTVAISLPYILLGGRVSDCEIYWFHKAGLLILTNNSFNFYQKKTNIINM